MLWLVNQALNYLESIAVIFEIFDLIMFGVPLDLFSSQLKWLSLTNHNRHARTGRTYPKPQPY